MHKYAGHRLLINIHRSSLICNKFRCCFPAAHLKENEDVWQHKQQLATPLCLAATSWPFKEAGLLRFQLSHLTNSSRETAFWFALKESHNRTWAMCVLLGRRRAVDPGLVVTKRGSCCTGDSFIRAGQHFYHGKKSWKNGTKWFSPLQTGFGKGLARHGAATPVKDSPTGSLTLLQTDLKKSDWLKLNCFIWRSLLLDPHQFTLRLKNRSADDGEAVALQHTLQHLDSSGTHVQNPASNTVQPVERPRLTDSHLQQVVETGSRVSAKLTVNTGSTPGCCLSHQTLLGLQVTSNPSRTINTRPQVEKGSSAASGCCGRLVWAAALWPP